MRRLALLAAGMLCGALAVSAQDDAREDALVRQIDRLKALLEERIGKQAPPAETQLVLRTYDVADLRAPMHDRRQSLEDLPASNVDPAEEGPEPDPPEAFGIDPLIEIIKYGVEPECWEIEGSDIWPADRRIFVNTIPRVHGKIERLLRWCRTCMDRRVSVEVAVVPVREADAALLSGVLELTAEEAQRLLQQEPLGTLTLSGFDGQLLGGRAGREIAYLHDYDVEVSEDVAIGDPITMTAFAGCTAEVRACLDDGQGVILHCQLELSRIAEPIPVHPTEHGNIDLPTKLLTRVQSSFWAPLGRTVVAGGCTTGENPCVILVTARRK